MEKEEPTRCINNDCWCKNNNLPNTWSVWNRNGETRPCAYHILLIDVGHLRMIAQSVKPDGQDHVLWDSCNHNMNDNIETLHYFLNTHTPIHRNNM